MELLRDKIILENKIGKRSLQVLLEGDVIVPDVKPDMSAILQTQANVIIDNTEILTDKVNCTGRLEIQVLYMSKGVSICSLNSTSNIDEMFSMDGIANDMSVDLSVNINKIDYKMLNDRKVNYRAVLDVSMEVFMQHDKELIVGISNISPTQLLQRKLNVSRLIENRQDRFNVKDELNISAGKPNIRELLQYSIDIINRDIKIGNGKITASGELSLKTLYRSDTEENIVELVEHEIPFNGVFDVPKAKDYMFADVKLCVQDKHVQVKTNTDGEDRLLDVDVSIGAIIKIRADVEHEVLDDAYCINKSLEIIRDNISYPQIICKNRTQNTLKEVVQLEDVPGALQILKVNGKAHIDDSRVIDDRVIAEGIVDIDMLYIAESDETPLYSFKTILPYKQVIEAKNATGDMQTDIEVSIDHIGFNLLSSNEIEFRFLLSFNTLVTDDKQTDIVTDILFNEFSKEELESIPSMVVYIVQPNDTLWNIAKRYNISIEDLREINDIEEEITLGQKLLVLKNS